MENKNLLLWIAGIALFIAIMSHSPAGQAEAFSTGNAQADIFLNSLTGWFNNEVLPFISLHIGKIIILIGIIIFGYTTYK